ASAIPAPLLPHRTGHGLPVRRCEREEPVKIRDGGVKNESGPFLCAVRGRRTARMTSEGRAGVGSAVGAMGAIMGAAAMVAVRDHLASVNAVLILVLFVLLGATIGGRRAGVLSALAAAAAFDFFFTTPYNSLKIDNAEQIETTVLLLIVGLAIGEIS